MPEFCDVVIRLVVLPFEGVLRYIKISQLGVSETLLDRSPPKR